MKTNCHVALFLQSKHKQLELVTASRPGLNLAQTLVQENPHPLVLTWSSGLAQSKASELHLPLSQLLWHLLPVSFSKPPPLCIKHKPTV